MKRVNLVNVSHTEDTSSKTSSFKDTYSKTDQKSVQQFHRNSHSKNISKSTSSDSPPSSSSRVKPVFVKLKDNVTETEVNGNHSDAGETEVNGYQSEGVTTGSDTVGEIFL